MKSCEPEWVRKISESCDYDRLLITMGYGFGHAFLGLLAGGFLTMVGGVGVESLNLMPPNTDPIPWIVGGGVVGSVVGFIVGVADMWDRASN